MDLSLYIYMYMYMHTYIQTSPPPHLPRWRGSGSRASTYIYTKIDI